MHSNARNALDEARNTVRELAMYLLRVADQGEYDERDELMKMAAELAQLSGCDSSRSWECLPTHAGNRLQA